ncbi:MAG: hypothetical protein AB8B50_09775 [Pirellulaceae bacterium]
MVLFHGPRFWALASLFFGCAVSYPFLRKQPSPVDSLQPLNVPSLRPDFQDEHLFASKLAESRSNGGSQAKTVAFSEQEVPDLRQLPAELPDWAPPVSHLDELLNKSVVSTSQPTDAEKVKRLAATKTWTNSNSKENRHVDLVSGTSGFPASSEDQWSRSPFDTIASTSSSQDEAAFFGSNATLTNSTLQAAIASSDWPDQRLQHDELRQPAENTQTNRQLAEMIRSPRDTPTLRRQASRPTSFPGRSPADFAGNQDRASIQSPPFEREGFALGPGSLVRSSSGFSQVQQRRSSHTPSEPYRQPNQAGEEKAASPDRKKKFVYQPGYSPDD